MKNRLFKHGLIVFPVTVLFYSCQPQNAPKTLTQKYKTIDYVEVGQRLPNAKVPYIIDLKNKSKRLVFIGCQHVRDPSHPQFAQIEQYFKQLQPQLAFNEGGQVKDSVQFSTMAEAITKKGKTGCLKYLCDQVNIQMVNGDLTFKEEFPLTLKSI